MKIICYGDSNTWGYDPRGPFGSQYSDNWPSLLARMTGFSVSNEGENGREIPKLTVQFPEDTDLLIIMLGTNDLLQFWTPEAACDKMDRFLTSMSLERSRILLIAPPRMIFGEWVQDRELIDDCITLARLYQNLAERLGIRFTDASQWQIPLAFDGVHLTEEGHRIFAEGLYRYLTKENNNAGNQYESTGF